MENIKLADSGLKNELTLGKELAMQLKHHLISPSSSQETRELLLNKILNSYDRALYMLQPHVVVSAAAAAAAGEGIAFESPRPRSLSLSPRSEDSDREVNRNHSIETPKKRKNMPRWTKHVQVSPGNGLEGPLDDGCSWRKYGQKDILGAKYPRGYYRCTLRHLQGCLATKQVQRTDDDPTIFEITYRGTHTCNQAPSANQDPAISAGGGVAVPPHQKPMSPLPLQNQPESLISFQTNLKVRTDNLEDGDFPDLLPLIDDSLKFCPPSSNANFGSSNYHIFGSSMMMDNDFGGNACPSLMDKDLVTTTTSTTTIGADFPIGQMEFAPNFAFHDNLGFFS